MKKTVEDIDLKGKKVIMRADFNVPLNDAGEITDDTRIEAALPTIKYILGQNAALILMSHLGRPANEPDPKYSFAPVAKALSEKLGLQVIFNDDGEVVGEVTKKAATDLKPGQVLLLQNTRFRPEEKKNNPDFSKDLASLADIYVDDAFGSCHRAHASTEGIAKYLPAVSGFLIQKELKFIGGALDNPQHPFVAILGGAKVSDKIGLAVADSFAALIAGADGVKASVIGDDALKTDSFSKAFEVKAHECGLASNLRLTEIHSDIETLLRKMQSKQTKDDFVSMEGSAVFLDSESTIQQVGEAVKSLGYDLSDEDLGKVYEALMKLKSYIGTMSNKVNSVTNVVLERDGELINGTGIGGGPIDSAFMAIEQCIGHHYELDDFQIQAVTEGKESLGSALVRLRSNGKLYSGNGLSSDICGASIRAYINALNKIAFEESQR